MVRCLESMTSRSSTAACAYREVPAEVDALLRSFKRHRDAKKVRRAGSRARRGPRRARPRAGAPRRSTRPRSTCSAMCAGPRHGRGGRRRAVGGRSRHAGLQHPGDFDLAITMLNSLCHLLTLDASAAAPSLRARGTWPPAAVHLRARAPGRLSLQQRRTSSEWSSTSTGGTVSVRWGAHDHIDPVTQVTRERVSVTYHRPGGSVRTVTDVVPNRSGPRPNWPPPSGWLAVPPLWPAMATSPRTARGGGGRLADDPRALPHVR